MGTGLMMTNHKSITATKKETLQRVAGVLSLSPTKMLLPRAVPPRAVLREVAGATLREGAGERARVSPAIPLWIPLEYVDAPALPAAVMDLNAVVVFPAIAACAHLPRPNGDACNKSKLLRKKSLLTDGRLYRRSEVYVECCKEYNLGFYDLLGYHHVGIAN